MPRQSFIATADGVADSYLASPAGTPRAGVLFLVDAFGLRGRTEEMADRIAAEGYAVLVPNVFYREGRAPVLEMPADMSDGPSREALLAKLGPLMAGLTPAVMERDGAAYLDCLAAQAPGPVGITGYCMGGRLGWRIAAAHPDRVAALGCFHTGGLVTDAEDSPHRSAAALRCELYLGFADQDPSMSAEQIAELERVLRSAGAAYSAEVYPGATHGYTMSDMAAYDEAACERHYRELFALLDRALAGSEVK